jgi:sugar phosphate isomerase/epimerase
MIKYHNLKGCAKMKLGVLTVPLYGMPAEQAFEYLSGLGVTALEIGAGGYPGTGHLNPGELLGSRQRIDEYKALLAKNNLEVSAISVHGNAVHPDKAVAKKAHEDFLNGCKVAVELGADTVVTFSGCPGDYEGARYPNWVTISWPPDFLEVLKYQWEEVLIPYWQSAVKEAAAIGVKKIALEMHPGFCVYNPATLLRLREAVGEAIGANVDPSHLYWQGMKPAESIKALKGAIYHFHAKDTKVDDANVSVNGVLDPAHYSNVLDRAWVFRTVGYGHGLAEWKEIISTLAAAGYDGAVSIEHEDSFMSITEGLTKAVAFLKEALIFEKPSGMWWA